VVSQEANSTQIINRFPPMSNFVQNVFRSIQLTYGIGALLIQPQCTMHNPVLIFLIGGAGWLVFSLVGNLRYRAVLYKTRWSV